MDTLTHALSGALLARASAPRRSGPDQLTLRARVMAGTAAGAFPDIDFVLGYLSPVVYLEQHRGVTHSILLLPLWALALAWLLSRLARDARGPAPWYGVCVIGIATHVAGDLITSFGTMILAPVSNQRFALGTTFIIDLWFSGIIVAGLAASLARGRTRVPAMAASLGLVAYVGMQAIAKLEAERFAVRYAQAQSLPDARVEAQPRPVSPFNWTAFVTSGERVDYSHVNILRREALPEPDAKAGLLRRLDAAYRPLSDARWQTRSRFGETDLERSLARSAWRSRAIEFFRWFAVVPVYDGTSPGSSCVWFRDLRFETPGRATVAFRYGVCRDSDDAPWRLAANDDERVVSRDPGR